MAFKKIKETIAAFKTIPFIKELTFRVHIIIIPDGDGFHAYCPSLKGLHMDGDTLEEALENVKEAVVAYLISIIKHNHPLPIGYRIVKEKEYKKLIPKGAHLYSENIVIPVDWSVLGAN